MTNDILKLLESLSTKLVTDPAFAADDLDRLGDLLKSKAAKMRASAQGHAPKSIGGVGDSCHLRVAGPDGNVKLETTAGG